MQSISQDRSSANTALQRSPSQLPIWPEAVRGGPNAILRSALFAGIQSKKRLVLGTQIRPDIMPEGVPIASQDGVEITFAGTQFNQYDADVFFEILHRARRQKLETVCEFQGADFLNSIGRSASKLCYEDLAQSLERLRRGSILLKWTANGRPYVFSGGLIAYFIRETTTKMYQVVLAKQVLTLFSAASWTQLEWKERMALKGKPLAQWLHSYFSTHAHPFPVSVSFLHEKSGSPTTLEKHFKTELKNALKALETTLGWTIAWNRNLVSVSRTPSASQKRHLADKAFRAKRAKEHREAHQRKLERQLGFDGRLPSSAQTDTFNMVSTKQILQGLVESRGKR